MTFDEVDEQLTLQRYNDLCRFWRKCPPTQVLIANYVGYKGTGSSNADGAPKEVPLTEPIDWDAPAKPTPMDDESAMQLFSMFGPPPIRSTPQ